MSKAWENEPNIVSEKIDGYHKLILRNRELGILNGYVGVTSEHPWFGVHYDNIPSMVDVHGGLTYSSLSTEGGFKKGYWYFGFDTAHLGDLIPFMIEFQNNKNIIDSYPNVYRDINYVKKEVDKLLSQIKAFENRNQSVDNRNSH